MLFHLCGQHHVDNRLPQGTIVFSVDKQGYVLYTALFTLYTSLYLILHTALYHSHCILHSTTQCTHHSHYTLHHSHYTLHYSHCILHPTLYYILHCNIYTTYGTLHYSHNVLHVPTAHFLSIFYVLCFVMYSLLWTASFALPKFFNYTGASWREAYRDSARKGQQKRTVRHHGGPSIPSIVRHHVEPQTFIV